MSVVLNLVDVRCWNHILQDCGRSRGRAGLGNNNLRPQYISAKIDLSDIVQFAVCQPQDIVNAIRENQFIASPVQEEIKKVDDHPKLTYTCLVLMS